MKYCSKCGMQLMDSAEICPRCMTKTEGNTFTKKTGLKKVSKAFMTLSTVMAAIGMVGFTILAIVFMFASKGYAGSEETLELAAAAMALGITYIVMAVFSVVEFFVALFMTKHYFKACTNEKPVGIAFKVCTLLFVNMIAGICMLCDKDE